MDVFETMRGRRSIRSMTDGQIPPADLDAIIEAGRGSASWANTQCWEIIVVREQETKDQLAQLLSPSNPGRKAVVGAPVVLVACGKKNCAGFKGGQPSTILGDWLMFDVALFLSNVTHAAHALGYGSLHVGLFDHVGVAELLGVPGDVQVVEMMPLGVPAAAGKAGPPRKSPADFVHHERY